MGESSTRSMHIILLLIFKFNLRVSEHGDFMKICSLVQETYYVTIIDDDNAETCVSMHIKGMP